MPADRQEKDDFWDLDKLAPKSKKTLSPFATRSPMVEYTDSYRAAPPTDSGDRRLTSLPASPHGFQRQGESYTPAHQRLIRRVTVRRYEGRYMFYDSFRRSAELYYDVHGTPSPFVPFYSYMPQYQQMSREQKDYYFYWRDEVRAGRYIKTDVSYVYLHAYEIINLPEKQTLEEGLRRLVMLWRTYRRVLRGIDKHFSVWIQDFCLLYRLSPPVELVCELLPELLSATTFKEFYLIDEGDMSSDGIRTLLSYFSDYDYHAGRYYTKENKEAVDRHMSAALGPILSRILSDTDAVHAPTALLVREAFPNSLCTHEVKCRLEIEYHPLTRAAALRSAVTAAVKYTENRLRALLGVKSRLAIRDLHDEDKALIDRYFDELLRAERREQQRRTVPSYEEKYDVPREALSFVGADDIERTSWDNTLRLVSEEEAAELYAPPPPADGRVLREEPPPPAAQASDTDTYGLAEEALDALRKALGGGFTSDMQTDALAEQINEAFSQGFGDIVLERQGDAYTVIEDYREDVRIWLSSKGM